MFKNVKSYKHFLLFLKLICFRLLIYMFNRWKTMRVIKTNNQYYRFLKSGKKTQNKEKNLFKICLS